MDEPFTGLDINIKQQIIKLFITLWNKDKRTVFFVSHNLDEALSVSNNIYIMSKKPMKMIDEFKIKSSQNKRQLYNKDLIQIKKQLLQTIAKW
jgi:ABC-type nitrate/sulfonate/bicarbonate transport system ATPase subunit